MGKKNNTKKRVPKKVEKPEVTVRVQEKDVEVLENDFDLDAEKKIDEIVEEAVAGEEPIVEEEIELNEAVVEERLVVEEAADEPLSDEDKAELMVAEVEAIAEIANEAEEAIAQTPVEEKGLVYGGDYIPDPAVKRTLADISSVLLKNRKRKTVDQLTREEYKLYQRTGILPNL